MRRTTLVLIAFYVVLVGGGTYYANFFPVRVLHHAVMTAGLVYWFARYGLPHTSLNRPLALAVGAWLISAIFSLDPRMALENMWFPLVHIGLFMVIVRMMQRGQQKLVFEITFLLSALVVVIGGLQLISWLFGLGITPDTTIGWLSVGEFPPPETPMIYLPVGVSTWLAALVAPLVIVAAAWAMTAFQRNLRPVLWVLAVGLVVVLIGTTSRGGFISLGVGAAAFVGLRVFNRAQGKLTKETVRVIGGGLIGLALVAVIVLLVSQNPGRAAGDTMRLNLWNGAVQMFASDPLTGVGVGLFGRGYREVRPPTGTDDRHGTAHNSYLNGLAENGLIGLAAGGFLVVTLAVTWWRNRSAAEGQRRLRLDACGAALIGFGVQSFFDSFVSTTLVSVTLVLTAYIVTAPRPRAEYPRPDRRLGFAAAGVFAVFGVGLLIGDVAHNAFNTSVRSFSDSEAIVSARAAVALDPSLRLYTLQANYAQAQAAIFAEDWPQAINLYVHALAVEPTWLVGWLNLAWLYEQNGQYPEAIDATYRAQAIRADSTAQLTRARIADATGTPIQEDLIDLYVTAMLIDGAPRSGFWLETPARVEALERFIADDTISVELRYRAAEALMPELRADLVPDNPQTADQWWVVGQHRLTVEDDVEGAVEAFDQAIALARGYADYRVSRARAMLTIDAAQSLRDLDIATLLTPMYEYPNAVRLEIAFFPEEIEALRVNALPPRTIDQNFEGVLFGGRVASFEMLEGVRAPGPGRAVMAPWYALAEDAIADGALEEAINVYRAIVNYAPGEREARDRLAELTADSGT